MNKNPHFLRMSLAGCVLVTALPLWANESRASEGVEAVVEYRQSVMNIIGWNFKNMSGMLKGKQPYEQKAFDKRLRRPEESCRLLEALRNRLAEAESFEADALERLLHDFIECEGIQIGQIIHALRVAVTGKAVGFGMFETLAILGRGRCLARIQRALDRCADAQPG